MPLTDGRLLGAAAGWLGVLGGRLGTAAAWLGVLLRGLGCAPGTFCELRLERALGAATGSGGGGGGAGGSWLGGIGIWARGRVSASSLRGAAGGSLAAAGGTVRTSVPET